MPRSGAGRAVSTPVHVPCTPAVRKGVWEEKAFKPSLRDKSKPSLPQLGEGGGSGIGAPTPGRKEPALVGAGLPEAG